MAERSATHGQERLMGLRDRLPMLLEMRKEHLRTLQANASDPSKDRTGTATSSLQGTLRFIGVAEFVIADDAISFRQHLAHAARLKLRLFERQLAGESIDPSLVSMLAYTDVFNALAAAEMKTAGALAGYLGGRPELEERYDHPFNRCLGHTLKAFVAGANDQIVKWSAEFTSVCQMPENSNFAGYATAFHGILHHDMRVVERGLADIVKGHNRLVKRGGLFSDMEDEMICVWGVGMANLARSRMIPVAGVPPFIPGELLRD